MDEIVCRVINLPPRVKAITVVDEEGDYNIYVNAQLSHDEQRRAYKHECRHIRKHHFHSHKSVETCEQEADQ